MREVEFPGNLIRPGLGFVGKNLPPHDIAMSWGLDADLRSLAIDGDERQHDVVSNSDTLSCFSAKHEHLWFLLEK
jgi:hypothetical protein